MAWDTIDASQYAKEGIFTVTGHVEGTQLTTKLHVRVSSQTEIGKNISDQWTGSELPLAFASDSHSYDPVSNVNDKVISYGDQPANRWSNWKRSEEASVGVLFGDSGILTKRSVDNLNVAFYEDSGVGAPKSYVIEYYVGEKAPTAPKNPGYVEGENHVFNDSKNWKPVTNLKAPDQLKAGEMNHFSFDKVDTYAVRIRMTRADDKLGTSITELQVFSKKVAPAKEATTKIKVAGKDLPHFNPDLTDYYLDYSDGKIPEVTASITNNGLATVVPSVKEGDPVRVIVKAENGDILGEYNLHFTKDKDLLARKPIASAKQSQLLQLGQPLELPNKVPVYFAGKSGYDVKDLAVEWEKVPASTLNKAGEYTIKGHVVGSEVPVELSVRVTDKVGRSLSDNPDYLATHSQAFASATNDLDDNSNDRVDYLNDNDRNQDNRWTNWSATPSANPEVSVGVIFKKNGKIVDRKVSQAKLNFFADSGTDAPAKLVLERYIGPDFDVPVYYSNYSYESNHPFNNPDNWELVPYYADKEIQAGNEINVTFKAVTTKAMRWRMDRKADKNGVALTELSFRAPSELAKESTEGRILVDGKELPDFSENRLDYELIYKGERPKITVEGKDQVTSTIVDSGNENLPVLVRLVSESGKNVKEYRIKLTKEKVIDAKLVAPAQYDLPSLEVVDKELNFQTLEQKDDTLFEGEVRLLQEGKVGKERIYTEVTTDGKNKEKSREILEEPVNRILLVGTKKKTSNIETPAGGHQDNGSSQPTEQKPGANPNPNIVIPNPSNNGVTSNSSDFKNHLSVAPNIVIQAPTQESKKPGWNKEDGKWYYRQQNGDLAKGWVKDGDTWYYFDQTGKMETGWIKDQSGAWYYLNQSGAMSSNEWILDQDGKWYYVDASGSMKTSQWFQVGDKWYYVDANGSLAVNTVTPDGYQVNENGEWIG